MNAKAVFWRSLHHFKRRNGEILPQAQLQAGANERWMMREFALAMNRQFSGKWAPSSLAPYADCERSYADISVWDRDESHPAALYEGKVFYRGQSESLLEKVVGKAWDQLAKSTLGADRKIGLFFAVYWRSGPKSHVDRADVDAFKHRVRRAVRTQFRSDHNIRLTRLSPLSEIGFPGPWGRGQWHTASWITWGTPIE